MMRSGSADPLFVVDIGALFVFDNLSTENKDKYSQLFLDFFNKEFDIPDERWMK